MIMVGKIQMVTKAKGKDHIDGKLSGTYRPYSKRKPEKCPAESKDCTECPFHDCIFDRGVIEVTKVTEEDLKLLEKIFARQ